MTSRQIIITEEPAEIQTKPSQPNEQPTQNSHTHRQSQWAKEKLLTLFLDLEIQRHTLTQGRYHVAF